MPNFCHNTLSIEGEKNDIHLLKKEIEKNENPSIENLYPMPNDLENTISPPKSAIGMKYSNEHKVHLAKERKETIIELMPCNNNTKEKQTELNEKYGYCDWHAWKTANWGSKWIDEFEFIKISDEIITCVFDSAWNPPITLIEKISTKFPNLDFSLSYNIVEEMGDQSKIIIIKKGKVQ